MNNEKGKVIYLLINIPIIIMFLGLMIASFFMLDIKYYLGIICRVLLGIGLIFNGAWNLSMDRYFIFKNGEKPTPNWGWWIFILVGVGMIVTALMGYGFNNVSKPN